MKKRPSILRKMNFWDKTALGALCVLVGAGIAATVHQSHQNLPIGGEMTVEFSDVGDSFGKDILLGERVTDHNQAPVGTVSGVARDEKTCLITITTTPDYPGAAGQTVFLRSKHFAGTGRITSYSLPQETLAHALR